MVSRTESHTIDNVDPDVPGQNPNDANFAGKIENGNAISISAMIGGITTLATGLPYNVVTALPTVEKLAQPQSAPLSRAWSLAVTPAEERPFTK